AIAPYFGHNYPSSEIPPATAAYPTVDEIVTTVSTDSIPIQQDLIALQKAVADAQGWSLICYEGGQHFTGIFAAANDVTLTGILTNANRDPRMGTRYTEYLDMLEAAGVEMFCNFNDVNEFGRSGSWGLVETMDQDIATAPKYLAVSDWIAQNVAPTQAFADFLTAQGVTGPDADPAGDPDGDEVTTR
ncbi:MAG: hypothetical protein ACI8UO_004084, partial [Verrucomicrobiales bacterium]